MSLARRLALRLTSEDASAASLRATNPPFVHALAPMLCGTAVAVAAGDGSARVVDAASGAVRHAVRVHGAPLAAIACPSFALPAMGAGGGGRDDGGHLIVTAANDATICVCVLEHGGEGGGGRNARRRRRAAARMVEHGEE